MPLGDKSGPVGDGPMTGRGVGRCTGRRRTFPNPSGRGMLGSSVWSKIVLPLGGIILTDLMLPNSVLKRLTGVMAKRLSTSTQRYFPKS